MSYKPKLDFDTWCDIHIDEMSILFAETGADREMDFDLERALEAEYQKYLHS